MDYIIVNDKKIIIDYKNDTKFYVEDDSMITPLGEAEQVLINEIFKENNEFVFYDELLSLIVEDNKNFDQSNKFLTPLLEFVSSVVPLKYRGTFYKNLSTLKIEHNLDHINRNCGNNFELPRYIGHDKNDLSNANKIVIPGSYLGFIYNATIHSDNPVNSFNIHFNFALLHELFHVASSKFDPDTEIFYCGLYESHSDDPLKKNRGLTEGITNLLASDSIRKFSDKAVGYPIETLIASQLRFIVGYDKIIDSYFGNKGVGELVSELNKLYDDKELSINLFKRIEDNYKLQGYVNKKKSLIPQSLLSSVQLILIFYLEKKMEVLKANGYTDQIVELLSLYENALITPESLTARGIDNSCYLGLNKSIDAFSKLTKKYGTFSR